MPHGCHDSSGKPACRTAAVEAVRSTRGPGRRTPSRHGDGEGLPVPEATTRGEEPRVARRTRGLDGLLRDLRGGQRPLRGDRRGAPAVAGVGGACAARAKPGGLVLLILRNHLLMVRQFSMMLEAKPPHFQGLRVVIVVRLRCSPTNLARLTMHPTVTDGVVHSVPGAGPDRRPSRSAPCRQGLSRFSRRSLRASTLVRVPGRLGASVPTAHVALGALDAFVQVAIRHPLMFIEQV